MARTKLSRDCHCAGRDQCEPHDEPLAHQPENHLKKAASTWSRSRIMLNECFSRTVRAAIINVTQFPGGVVIRILLVEDDDVIAKRLISGLESAGFVVDRITNGEDAWPLGRENQYDAAVLDLGLPGIGGLEVLQNWRAAGITMPVLILTARGTWPEKVRGLNAGADDYIGKPFHLPEVVARLRALTRRTSGAAHPVLSHKNITLDTIAGKATVAGQSIALTALELRMLTYFLLRVGRIVSQKELADHLYSLEDEVESNTIEVYVARLRKKLGRHSITTVRGLGYRMD